jgi:lipopolysaccharide transport system permease protein
MHAQTAASPSPRPNPPLPRLRRDLAEARPGRAKAGVGGLRRDLAEMLREQVDYRELLFRMTRRDLLLRYKQTVMGIGWAVMMPLLNTAIFSVIFTRVAPIDVGVPYPIFAYCGLVTWSWFASALRFSVSSLTGNANLVAKVYFPREVFPFSAVIVSVVDFLVASVVLVALLLYYRVEVGSALLVLPLVLLAQAIFTTAIALVLAMANLFYRDVKYLFEILIVVWMFATSVLYPLDAVGGTLGTLLGWNPMTHFIDAFRAIVIFNQAPPATAVAAMLGGSTALLVFGWLMFHRAEFLFAENI